MTIFSFKGGKATAAQKKQGEQSKKGKKKSLSYAFEQAHRQRECHEVLFLFLVLFSFVFDDWCFLFLQAMIMMTTTTAWRTKQEVVGLRTQRQVCAFGRTIFVFFSFC